MKKATKYNNELKQELVESEDALAEIHQEWQNLTEKSRKSNDDLTDSKFLVEKLEKEIMDFEIESQSISHELRRIQMTEDENKYSSAHQKQRLTELTRELDAVLASNAAEEQRIN